MRSVAEYARLIPVPGDDAHKYSRGKAVVIGGSAAYPGAVCLCAQAAQFAGAGYTQVFTDDANISLVRGMRPSLVVGSFHDFDLAGVFKPEYPGALVIGSGFDAEDEAANDLLKKVIAYCQKPIVIDGGALSMVACVEGINLLQCRAEAGLVSVLTPHAGEASRLAQALDISAQEEQTAFACALAEKLGCIVVLKGSNTVVAQPSLSTMGELITNGTAVLAKAGTGDVLAGVIGGLLAQGVAPFDAACLGVYIHAEAGNAAAQRYGIVSACAEEVLENIPASIMNTLALR